MEGYKSIPLCEKVAILKQLKVWRKMSKAEQHQFLECKNENYADRLMRDLRSKYLM